jgi:glycosyltransferase involved in cell wall biosynthesis
MHLLIDGQALQTLSSRQRGIGRYAGNFLRGLAAVRPNWRIEVVQNSALTPIATDNLHGWPVLAFQPPQPLHPDYHEINDRYYADWLTAQGADGVLVPSYCEGWDAILPSFCGPRPRLFAIVHDLIPLLYPEQYLPDLEAVRWYAQRFRQLLQCDALLANSEATAHDVRMLGGSDAPRVVNIGGAADPLFAPLSPGAFAVHAREIRKRFGLQREFLLYVGAPDYRKNLHGVLRAFAALPSRYRAALDLAVVCRMKPDERAAIETMARQTGVASALYLINSANDEELRTLYMTCRIFFFPSLYEGLGLPVLEALHCGAPVVTSDRSSLPEYAGPYSWLCDPTSPQAMAQALQQALAEPREAHRRQRQQFARTFSWQKTAERACAVMERISKKCIQPRPRRRRLAWVMPLMGNTHSLTEYAAELLPLLAEHFDIEVIAAGSLLHVPQTLSRSYLILTAREVPARHAALPYDMFVYQFGPLPVPPEMLDLLQRFPGLVVRHDFSAPDFRRLAAACAARIDRAILGSEQSDGLWSGFAVRCLADCADKNEAILSSWAALRVRGQQHVAARQTRPFSSGSESVTVL